MSKSGKQLKEDLQAAVRAAQEASDRVKDLRASGTSHEELRAATEASVRAIDHARGAKNEAFFAGKWGSNPDLGGPLDRAGLVYLAGNADEDIAAASARTFDRERGD